MIRTLTTLAFGKSRRGILPQLWSKMGQNSQALKYHHMKLRALVLLSGALEQVCLAWAQAACSSCFSQVFKTKLAITACCALSLHILYHTPLTMLVFSKGKENIPCYLEFSMITLCPEVTCPSKETFSIMQYFFKFSCLYLQRQSDKWRDK